MRTQDPVVRPVRTAKDRVTFISFPWEIYKDDPHWVPPLRVAVKEVLDTAKNPFYKHAKLALFLAERGGKVVGRVAGVIDDTHNQVHQEKAVMAGFFESIDDQAVANALLDAVMAWGRSNGMTILRGPNSPSTNHECGMLLEGFNDSPNVLMTYNPPYYIKLWETWGFKKAKDLYAYNVPSKAEFTGKLIRVTERLRERKKVTFREANFKKFKEELNLFFEIYNDAWETNWGFVPMNREEFDYMCKDLKAITEPWMVLVAEVDGEPAGFGLAFPDANQAIKKVKDGKLLPFGLFKLLWNLKGPGAKKTITRARIATLGIKKKFVNYGIGPLLYTEYLRRVGSRYEFGEASWILEDNVPMLSALENMRAYKAKTYRMYERPIAKG